MSKNLFDQVNDKGGKGEVMDGPKSQKWREETAKRNMKSGQAAAKKQDELEAAGYKYNSQNGTWGK